MSLSGRRSSPSSVAMDRESGGGEGVSLSINDRNVLQRWVLLRRGTRLHPFRAIKRSSRNSFVSRTTIDRNTNFDRPLGSKVLSLYDPR